MGFIDSRCDAVLEQSGHRLRRTIDLRHCLLTNNPYVSVAVDLTTRV